MPWQSEILELLEERSVKPYVVVEKIQYINWGTAGGPFVACTNPDLRSTSTHTIVAGSLNHNGYKLNLQTWITSGGGFSFQVWENPNFVLARGHHLRLAFGFAGTSEIGYLDLGVVDQVAGAGGVKLASGEFHHGPWIITCTPFYGALRARPSTNVDDMQLFFDSSIATAAEPPRLNLGGEFTEVDSGGYTAGDSHLDIDTGVNNTVNFDAGESMAGAVKVYVDDDTWFYGLYGSKVTAEFQDFEGGVHDTTDDDVPAGGRVEELPYLRGHPSQIFRALLTSTGSGANGDYDVYPEGWGFAVPDEVIDHDDADLFATWSDAPSGTEFAIIPDPPPPDPMSWIVNLFAPGGWFPVMHQGCISFRAMVSPLGDSGTFSDIDITDGDLVDDVMAVTHRVYAEGAPYSYGAMSVYSGPLAAELTTHLNSDGINAHPAQPLYVVSYGSNATGYLDGPDRDEQREEILDRLADWYFRVPETWTIRCAGLRLMQLSIGSRPTLTSGLDSSGKFSRLISRDGTAPRDRRVVVTGWKPNLMAGTVELELTSWPTFDTEVPDPIE